MIRWQGRQAHPSEKVIGRIRNDLGWDRRYRVQQAVPDDRTLTPLRLVAWFVAAFVTWGLIFFAVFSWMAVAS